MRMERINEHEIRCIVTRQDLSAHAIAPKDMKYGSKAMQELFRELLKDATENYQFNKDGLPVMIEAIPVSGNELLIIISAVENADELDPHFARFRDTSAPVEESNGFEETEEVPDVSEAVYYFDRFNDVIRFCKNMSESPVSTDLYQAKDPHTYYLVIHRKEEMSHEDFIRFLYGLNEFGAPIPNGPGLYEMLREHQTPVMEDPHLKLKTL